MIIVRKALNNGRVDKYNGWVTLLALLSLIIGLIDSNMASVGTTNTIEVPAVFMKEASEVSNGTNSAWDN